MKKLFVLILLAFALQVSAQQAKKVPYRTIRTLTADLNNDGKTDTIRLISSLEGRNDFDKISISLTGFGKTIFKARDYWTVVDSDFLLRNKNAIHTKLLFLKSTPVHSSILLFGELDGAGYRGEFSIINIENNQVKMVFDDLNNGRPALDVEVPVTVGDLQHDYRLDFIYTDYGQLEGPAPGQDGDIGSYNPYFVYKIDNSCKLDSQLTISYNQKHYLFVGFNYSEKIKIFYPKHGGKLKIWKDKIKK